MKQKQVKRAIARNQPKRFSWSVQPRPRPSGFSALPTGCTDGGGGGAPLRRPS